MTLLGAEAVDDLALRVERLAAGAVHPFVRIEIDVAALDDPPEDASYAASVPLLGRSDEVVVGDTEHPPQLVVPRHHPIRQLLGRDPLLRRGTLDLLAVL